MRFQKAHSFGLPIFSSGFAWWNILDTKDDDKGVVFCCVVFQLADHKHPGYKDYMTSVEAKVEGVVDQLNRGEK
jgi:hypothetical protein